MEVNPSELRQNIYNLLDQVIETGIPLEIKRKGHGDPEDLVSIDWSQNWKPEI